MKIAVVAATWMEVKPLEQFLLAADENGLLKKHSVEIMITNPGLALTAFHLGRTLPLQEWDLLIHAGICGSFFPEIVVGDVVQVTADRFGDWGAEDGEAFLDAFEIGLLEENKFPFEEGWLKNFFIPNLEEKFSVIRIFLEKIPEVKAISVNKVHGSEDSIQRISKKYQAQIETMEGAAVHYACLMQSQPFIQLRCVSNFIERRNKEHWNIPLAVSNLNKKLVELIQLLLKEESL